MQGLWTNHRRNKVNLNIPLPPSVAVSEEAVTGDPNTGGNIENAANPTQVVTTDVLPGPALPHTPLPASKRKTRSVRTADGVEERGSKRVKTSSARNHTPPNTRLSDLGGVQPCVEKMLELVAMPLSHPEVYLHTGIQPPRGVLLHGPPGCGKTLLANAIAGVSLSTLYQRMAEREADSQRRNLDSLSLAFLRHQLYQGCLVSQRRRSVIRLMRQRLVASSSGLF